MKPDYVTALTLIRLLLREDLLTPVETEQVKRIMARLHALRSEGAAA